MLIMEPSSCCDICLEEYCSDTSDKSPHSMECGHIFCGLCLRSVYPKQCPMCRASFERTTRLRAEAGFSSVSSTAPQDHHALCNICNSSIYGDRCKCLDCPDYDTCTACFDLTLENHPGHSFVIIHDPSDRIKRSQCAVEHNINCSNCKHSISGVRYQCTVCPDYDLCANCEALPIPVHSPAHPMVKIKSPTSATYAGPSRAKVSGPIIDSAADIYSSSDSFSQAMQANVQLLRLLEDDNISPSRSMQAKTRHTRQEQSLPMPLAQTNAEPLMPPIHETGPWEMRLERQYPCACAVCLRGLVDSEARLGDPLEEQQRFMTDSPSPPVPAPREISLRLDNAPAESIAPCMCRLCHPEPPRLGRLRKYASKVANLVHIGNAYT